MLEREVTALAAVIMLARNDNVSVYPLGGKQLCSDLRSIRYLEQVLQELVHNNVLTSVRGRRGGYRLARKANEISATDVLRACQAVGKGSKPPQLALVNKVVGPMLEAAMSKVSIADMVKVAERKGC